MTHFSNVFLAHCSVSFSCLCCNRARLCMVLAFIVVFQEVIIVLSVAIRSLSEGFSRGFPTVSQLFY